MIRKLILAATAIVVSNPAIAITAGLGATISAAMGFDPFTWMIGAFGGTVIQVKLPPVKKMEAYANGGISVLLAGLGAEYSITLLHALVSKFADFDKFPAPSVYLAAFLLSTLWPWGTSIIKARTKKWGGT